MVQITLVLVINHRKEFFSTKTQPNLVRDIKKKTFDGIIDNTDILQ